MSASQFARAVAVAESLALAACDFERARTAKVERVEDDDISRESLDE